MGVFWIIAGPNGVGKTTYAFRNLQRISGSINFVNLDEIARGLSPLDPAVAEREAARIALDRARTFIRNDTTFAMETTLSGRTHFALAERAHAAGMAVHLQYFSVTNPDICLQRIARRVAEGGHDVPPDVVRRRFERSLHNLAAFARSADLWRVYEASTLPPRLAIEGRNCDVSHMDRDVLSQARTEIRALAPDRR